MINIPIQPTVPKIPIPLKYIENNLKYIGSMDDLRTRGHTGDICTYQGIQYVWTDKQWESLMYIPSVPKHITAITCTQCGASLHSNICEYCGTEYRCSMSVR